MVIWLISGLKTMTVSPILKEEALWAKRVFKLMQMTIVDPIEWRNKGIADWWHLRQRGRRRFRLPGIWDLVLLLQGTSCSRQWWLGAVSDTIDTVICQTFSEAKNNGKCNITSLQICTVAATQASTCKDQEAFSSPMPRCLHNRLRSLKFQKKKSKCERKCRGWEKCSNNKMEDLMQSCNRFSCNLRITRKISWRL